MIGEEEKFRALRDHYVDTFAALKDHLKARERFFVVVIGLVTVTLFEMYSPDQAGAALGQVITKKLDLGGPIDISFLASLIWFGLLSFAIKYFQAVVHVERQYKYLHQLEDQLSLVYQGKAFTREGKSYLKRYPLFSKWTAILYSWIFPILLACVTGAKIVADCRGADRISPLLGVNVGIGLCLLISTGLYIKTAHFEK